MRGEVHCWRADLDVPPETVAALHATLTPDERDRSARFRFDRDRRRFVVARGALREILGLYVWTQAGHIRFMYNAFGKPALSPEFGSNVRFNLSHSADLAVIAVAAEADVGVDVECVREEEECADIDLRRWTKQEAFAKARGHGFASDNPGDARRWSLYPLQPAPGYVGALAIEEGAWRLRHWQW